MNPERHRAQSLLVHLVCGVLLMGTASGCKNEAGRVKRAYEDVIDHSTEYRRTHTIWKKKKLPGYVWAVRENAENPARAALEMDIAVPPHIGQEGLKKRLREAARIGKGATALGVVRVQAWPEGLLAYGGVLGTAHLAQDGRGWDGKGNTFRGVRVITGHGKGVRRPSAFDVEVLRALEKRQRIRLAAPKNRKRKAFWKQYHAVLEREVISTVARRLGLTTSSVKDTVDNARRYWWKPRWQPSPIVGGQ